MQRIIEFCKKAGKPYRTLPSVSELVSGNVSVNQFREVSLIDLLGRDEITIDESLIAGVIIRMGSLVADATVKNRLATLKYFLEKKEEVA